MVVVNFNSVKNINDGLYVLNFPNFKALNLEFIKRCGFKSKYLLVVIGEAYSFCRALPKEETPQRCLEFLNILVERHLKEIKK